METRDRTAGQGVRGDPDGRTTPEAAPIAASRWEALATPAELESLAAERNTAGCVGSVRRSTCTGRMGDTDVPHLYHPR